MHLIEHGEHGLVYLTDSTERGIFIAAASEDRAIALAAQARDALAAGYSIPDHTTHDHTNGGRMTVPDSEDMTPEQRQETIGRLQAHIKMRFVS